MTKESLPADADADQKKSQLDEDSWALEKEEDLVAASDDDKPDDVQKPMQDNSMREDAQKPSRRKWVYWFFGLLLLVMLLVAGLAFIWLEDVRSVIDRQSEKRNKISQLVVSEVEDTEITTRSETTDKAIIAQSDTRQLGAVSETSPPEKLVVEDVEAVDTVMPIVSEQAQEQDSNIILETNNNQEAAQEGNSNETDNSIDFVVKPVEDENLDKLSEPLENQKRDETVNQLTDSDIVDHNVEIVAVKEAPISKVLESDDVQTVQPNSDNRLGQERQLRPVIAQLRQRILDGQPIQDLLVVLPTEWQVEQKLPLLWQHRQVLRQPLVQIMESGLEVYRHMRRNGDVSPSILSSFLPSFLVDLLENFITVRKQVPTTDLSFESESVGRVLPRFVLAMEQQHLLTAVELYEQALPPAYQESFIYWGRQAVLLQRMLDEVALLRLMLPPISGENQ